MSANTHAYQGDWERLQFEKEDTFNASFPVGTPVRLLPTPGTTEGVVETVTAGAAFCEGREVKVLTVASPLPVNVDRIRKQ